MKYLIDTHILLWYMVGDNRITQDTQTKIENIDNTVFLSNASLWEIAIKLNIGKLKLKGSLTDLEEYLNQKGFIILEFNFEDLETLQTLPFHHQDPFDRMIISQAKSK
ncbi:type II toxin-antitoxin system VapC family toxin [Cyclobacterium salsum]|uniref:type II toxin-antitoxin system VapC family toxin n=1 Tax=Cyclobacterium salsum TaxID=2666329 RepID=UPI0013912055|nr:type II toxin-antitoxin system VapC family toxin [Cyclobacterium salsum]